MVKSYEQTFWVCYDCGKHHNTRMDGDLCCIPQPKVIGCGKILDDGVYTDDEGNITDDWVIICQKDGRLCEDCEGLKKEKETETETMKKGCSSEIKVRNDDNWLCGHEGHLCEDCEDKLDVLCEGDENENK